MKSKDEVTTKLQRFIIDVGRPGSLVSDGALEFKSKQFSGSAVTQRESEYDDASQSDVDDLKSVSYEQYDTTSTKTYEIQGESEDNINPDEGTPNVTDSTTAVQQTTT